MADPGRGDPTADTDNVQSAATASTGASEPELEATGAEADGNPEPGTIGPGAASESDPAGADPGAVALTGQSPGTRGRIKTSTTLRKTERCVSVRHTLTSDRPDGQLDPRLIRFLMENPGSELPPELLELIGGVRNVTSELVKAETVVRTRVNTAEENYETDTTGKRRVLTRDTSVAETMETTTLEPSSLPPQTPPPPAIAPKEPPSGEDPLARHCHDDLCVEEEAKAAAAASQQQQEQQADHHPSKQAGTPAGPQGAGAGNSIAAQFNQIAKLRVPRTPRNAGAAAGPGKAPPPTAPVLTAAATTAFRFPADPVQAEEAEGSGGGGGGNYGSQEALEITSSAQPSPVTMEQPEPQSPLLGTGATARRGKKDARGPKSVSDPSQQQPPQPQEQQKQASKSAPALQSSLFGSAGQLKKPSIKLFGGHHHQQQQQQQQQSQSNQLRSQSPSGSIGQPEQQQHVRQMSDDVSKSSSSTSGGGGGKASVVESGGQSPQLGRTSVSRSRSAASTLPARLRSRFGHHSLLMMGATPSSPPAVGVAADAGSTASEGTES